MRCVALRTVRPAQIWYSSTIYIFIMALITSQFLQETLIENFCTSILFLI